MKRINLYAILFIILAGLNGCIVYHLDIPQGNTVTQDQVTQLRPGLTKTQVQYLLGSSLLQDPFHADRWDYIYADSVNSKIRTEKKFTVFFEADQLIRWEGEVLPLSERARVRAENEAVVASQIAMKNQPPKAL